MNSAKKVSAKSSFRQVVFSFFYLLIFPVMLFFLAGDWYWIEGWFFSIIFFSLSFAVVVYLYFSDPELLNERFSSPVQKEQKSWDKIFLILFLLGFLIWFVVMPLDVKRFNWSPPFSIWIKTVGAVLLVSCFIALFAAFKENTFAAPVVKMQKERGQKVISTGIYVIVRHPMYLGGVLFFGGSPLLLGSVLGLIGGILLSAFIIFRIFGEEKMLIEELDGYAEYMKRVKWRVIPFVF